MCQSTHVRVRFGSAYTRGYVGMCEMARPAIHIYQQGDSTHPPSTHHPPTCFCVPCFEQQRLHECLLLHVSNELRDFGSPYDKTACVRVYRKGVLKGLSKMY